MRFRATEENDRDYEENDRDYLDDYDRDCDFADPGGKSALRAATASNPRDCPCPTCGRENALTPKDVALGYQCDRCADRAEGTSWEPHYDSDGQSYCY